MVFGFLLVSYQLQQPIAFCATVARSPLRLPEDISKFKGTAKMAKMVMVVMVVLIVMMVGLSFPCDLWADDGDDIDAHVGGGNRVDGVGDGCDDGAGGGCGGGADSAADRTEQM